MQRTQTEDAPLPWQHCRGCRSAGVSLSARICGTAKNTHVYMHARFMCHISRSLDKGGGTQNAGRGAGLCGTHGGSHGSGVWTCAGLVRRGRGYGHRQERTAPSSRVRFPSQRLLAVAAAAAAHSSAAHSAAQHVAHALLCVRLHYGWMHVGCRSRTRSTASTWLRRHHTVHHRQG